MQTKVNILLGRLNDNAHTSGVNKWRLQAGNLNGKDGRKDVCM
jgi:hypothetical protein